MIEIELIVGTMGLEKILAGKLPKYNPSLLSKAASTLKYFREGVDDFAKKNSPGSLPDETFKLKTFDELQEMLKSEPEMEDFEASLMTWPSELQMQIMTLCADVRAFLTEQNPQQEVGGFLFGDFIPVSDTDKFRFLMQANLCDDVRRYVDLLNSGAITPIESGIMRLLFPETNDYLVIEVIEKVMDASLNGKIKTWEGSWRKPALSGLLGVPVMNFSDVMGYQTGVQEKTAGRPKGPGAIQIAKLDLTENQAVQTNTIDRSKL